MSLVVIYEGQRKVVKIPSPNTLVQALLLECATQFNVDVSKVAFRHKRTILDNAQPIRFCNLSNNAQVDMIAVTGSGSAKNQSCKIALAVEGGENTTETFDSSISLFEMLSLLAAQNKIPADVHQRSPEVVYLRAKYKGTEALTSTTFTSLGLAGLAIFPHLSLQSARLQLRFAAAAASPVNAVPISVPIVPESQPTSTSSVDPIVVEGSAMDVIEEAVLSAPVLASILTTIPATAPVNVPSSSTSTLNSLSSHLSAILDTSSTTHSTNVDVPTNYIPSDKATVVTPAITISPSITAPILPTPTEAVNAILSDNFDRVSIPAVLTLSRYLLNILLNPSEEKFRRISTENKAFQSKVAVAKGAVTFLCSVGFVYSAYNNTVLVLLSSIDNNLEQNHNSSSVNTTVENSSVLTTAQLTLLADGYTQLAFAMQELNIPVEERPYQGADWNTLQKQQQAQLREMKQKELAQVAAFDPYKTHIVRTAPQPVRQKEVLKHSDSVSGSAVDAPAPVLVLSSTERQLLELNKKRTELEGNRCDVVRATEVLLPRVDGAAAPNLDPSSPTNNNDYNDINDHNDSKSVPRSVLSKILRKAGEDGDSTPLTTQALKDLQRAQKERVFTRTLIRIKFPDRVCLQGYFHPRDTVQEVYQWVKSCLLVNRQGDTSDGSGKSGSDKGNPEQWCFELYTSPPRTVLVPHTTNNNTNNISSDRSGSAKYDPSGISKSDAPTLSSLGFVPAAVIYLAWKNVNPKSTITLTTTAATATATTFGEYLIPELVAAAVAEDAGTSLTIPIGVSLVPPAPATDNKSSSAKHSGHTNNSSSSNNSSNHVIGVKASTDGATDVKKNTKPMWFSLK